MLLFSIVLNLSLLLMIIHQTVMKNAALDVDKDIANFLIEELGGEKCMELKDKFKSEVMSNLNND